MKSFVGIVVVVLILFQAALYSGTQTEQTGGPEKTVRTFLAALSNADLDGIVATFAEDATVFLPISSAPKRVTGRKQIREAFAPLIENIRSSGRAPPYMTLNPQEMSVQNLGTTAIITFHLSKVPSEASQQPVSFSRRTFVLQFRDNHWLIVHMHGSNLLLQPGSKD
jgi:uncharacterized protein (TIGR02246 family)